MKRLKKKAQSKEKPGRILLKLAAKTFKDKRDVAKEHDKYLLCDVEAKKPRILVFFGVPGSGKSHIAKVLARRLNVFFYEADDDYTEEMRRKSKTSRDTKNQINREFYSYVINKTKGFLKSHNKVFVATALGTQENRHQLFVLVNSMKPRSCNNC